MCLSVLNFCEEAVLVWKLKEPAISVSPSRWPGRIRPRGCPGGAQQQVHSTAFLSEGFWGGPPGRHRGAQEGRMHKTKWQAGHCANFRAVGFWRSVFFSFQCLERDGSIFVWCFFQLHWQTSKGKIHSGSPVCLCCSPVTSQRASLILYDFSSLIPWRRVQEPKTFSSNLTWVFFPNWATEDFLFEAKKY